MEGFSLSPTNSKNNSDSILAMANLQLDRSTVPESHPASNHKPVVVGLYGVPGSGKTFLLNQLKQELGKTNFAFYEGSNMIDTLVPGGLEAFQNMEETKKIHWRERAIQTIKKNSADSGQMAVVTGHFMFWSEERDAGQPVHTQGDFEAFTHVLYLDVSAEVVTQRCQNDTERNRPSISTHILRRWQQEEKAQLRYLCRCHGILFIPLSLDSTPLDKVLMLLNNFRLHTDGYNLCRAESRLDDIVGASHSQLETMLVLDADRTLAAADAGAMFWQRVSNVRSMKYEPSTLKLLFGGPLGYSYTAFRQAVLLNEEAANDQEFDSLCNDVAREITMYPEFVSLLQLVAEQKHVGAVVVTCGLCQVWEKVLERKGISEKVQVIGGGRIRDSFVVSPAVKGALVTRLQDVHHLSVWAFGDSPMDLNMLMKADRAIIVVGEDQNRSKTMDAALADAIDSQGFRACQTLFPSSVSPRLDSTKLPIVKLVEPEFVTSLLGGRYTHDGLKVLYATDSNAAKLLATSMRNAAIAGPALRKAHHRIGLHLALTHLADVMGLEECPIRHVLGHQTEGYQFLHEKQTTIVALMRGGEPMAFGVSDALPLAMFVHAGEADDVKLHHLEGQLTVILVDAVVNTGKTVVEFVQHIRKLHATIRIVVVAGVVQAQCISGGCLNETLARYPQVHIIALRLSETKFTGSGTTDTGNRLFNTTHLP